MPLKKVATIYDVAALAGVSIATVSFSFRRPDKVSPATRQAVLAAARQLAYVPSANAQGLVSGRTGVLGLCSYDYLEFSASTLDQGGHSNGDLRSYPIFIDEVQRGIQLESWRLGYSILVRGGPIGNNDAMATDLAARVDGLAVFPHTVSTDVLYQLSRRIPIVQLSEAPEGQSGLGFVTVDNRAAMAQLTEHVINVHNLHELVFVGSGSVDIDRRADGFVAAMHSAGLVPPVEPPGGQGRTPHAHQVSAVIKQIIEGGHLPQGFICATDQHAIVVLDVLQHAGISIPKDVVVTGFDGILASRFVRPTLTTVRQPMQDMGAAAVRMIVEAISRGGTATAVTGTATATATRALMQTLPFELFIGNSCGC